jgi:hypothetical protein
MKSYIAPLILSFAALTACLPDTHVDTTSDNSSTSGPTTEASTTDDPTTTEAELPTSTGSITEDPVDPTEEPNDPTSPGSEGDPPCVDTPTVLAFDAETPLGVSAEAFLADKLGPRSTTLTFLEEPLSLSDAWRGEQLPLTVELRYAGGEVRWIDSELNPDFDPTGNEGGFPGECEDRLEIEVGFDFVTEGLEFDEHHDAVLHVRSADEAQLRVDLLPPGISGSFDPAALYGDPEWEVRALDVGARFQGAAVGGSLLNEVLVGGDDGFVGFGAVAWWGDEIQP